MPLEGEALPNSKSSRARRDRRKGPGEGAQSGWEREGAQGWLKSHVWSSSTLLLLCFICHGQGLLISIHILPVHSSTRSWGLLQSRVWWSVAIESWPLSECKEVYLLVVMVIFSKALFLKKRWIKEVLVQQEGIPCLPPSPSHCRAH